MAEADAVRESAPAREAVAQLEAVSPTSEGVPDPLPPSSLRLAVALAAALAAAVSVL